MRAKIELTDTFGGEANYSWVRRAEVEAPTMRGIIRAAKSEFGLTGIRCETSHFGEEVWLRPRGACVILFVTLCDE